ncbi:MAG: MBOAT family O-acyltransferase [Lachnospiraceae bacterium]|nr:MBOAT family O-acyltransferase [Lachnospiraceae bacterium]
MIFSSLLFLFRFIPVFFLIYYLVPKRLKNVVLLIGSIIFYAWGEPKFLILIIISIVVNYVAGILIDHFKNKGSTLARLFFLLAIIYDLSTLFVFKYIDFFITNINSVFNADIKLMELTLPLGISFYTFQIMSYVIDLYKGRIKVCKSVIVLGTYLSMFPQLIAGPIVVYSDVAEKLEKREIKLADIDDGIKTFIIGLGSKVLIANNVGMLWDDIALIGYENIKAGCAWLGVLAFSLQIFFDFNGYSLMAIGLGKMLGFDFPKNFDYPYISKSLTEFWRRWHITLSSWFREYVYIPLGGNRKGSLRTYVNLFIVWFLTGFWHGAGWNFILWGMFFFVMLSVEKLYLKKLLDEHAIWAHIYSVIFIGLSWMIFAITDIRLLAVYFTKLLAFGWDIQALYLVRNYGVILIVGIVLCTPVFRSFYEKIKNKTAGVVILGVILVVSVAYLTDATYNPFLYFRF